MLCCNVFNPRQSASDKTPLHCSIAANLFSSSRARSCFLSSSVLPWGSWRSPCFLIFWITKRNMVSSVSELKCFLLEAGKLGDEGDLRLEIWTIQPVGWEWREWVRKHGEEELSKLKVRMIDYSRTHTPQLFLLLILWRDKENTTTEPSEVATMHVKRAQLPCHSQLDVSFRWGF